MRQTHNLAWTGMFAVVMAYVEAAVVVYLRRIYDITDLVRDPLSYDAQLIPIEGGREVATLLMLLAVGWATGRRRQSRLGFALFMFGVWDIFYYIWLRVFIGWPDSLLATDILFLLPLPWWGPVLSPVLIALLMVSGGGLAVVADDRGRQLHITPLDGGLLVAGVLMALYAFMADALAALPADAGTLLKMRPTDFLWPVYGVGWALMALATIRIGWRAWQRDDPAP